MGTSSMYNGSNRSPLLPSDFNDGDNNNSIPPNNPNQEDNNNSEGDNQPEKDNPQEKPDEKESSTPQELSSQKPQYTSWTSAKNSMSKYASGKGGGNAKGNAVSNYIKSRGGSENAAKSARSAIKTTINIGTFFSDVSKKGVNQVLEEYQIPIEGRKPKEILNDVVNVLAPTPDLNDDSVARKALINTMSIIYEKFDNEKQDISLLDSFDSDLSKMLITKYIETFIYERLIHDLGSRIERKAENSNTAARLEKDLKDYIETKVSTTLKDKPLSIINSQTKNVYVLVEGLYQQCYKVLEDQL